MVLGGEDDAFHAGLLGHVDPLAAVQCRGVEQRLGLVAGAPLGTREGVGTEMAEHVYLHALPCQLRTGRHRSVRLWHRRVACRQEQHGGD